MAERRTIGQILIGFGRITEADVERALGYQHQHGGYFGEALLGLGLVTQEELEWSLASQFDLPYVFPDPDSIDLEAAALVTPEWALANLSLPIMKTADSVTVVVDSPIKTGPVDELQRRSGLKIELALASAAKIRELIRQVYARIDTDGESDETLEPIDLTDLVTAALEQGSGTFGVSVRGHRATGWFQDRATTRRRLLTSGWAEEMEQLISPGPSAQMEGRSSGEWSAHLSRKGLSRPVEVRVMGAPGGTEYLFQPTEVRAKIHDRFAPPAAGVLAEVKLLVRSGSARFAVTTNGDALSEELVPHLPELFLDTHWRAVHLSNSDASAEDSDPVFRVRIPAESEARSAALAALRAFRFDAVTADLDPPFADWVDEVLDVAGVAFVPVRADGDAKVAEKAGVRWELRAERVDGDRIDWSLLPLKS